MEAQAQSQADCRLVFLGGVPRDIDIAKITSIAAFMEEKLKAYGLEYIQVDDGYQKMPLPFRPQGTMEEGWMSCEESKFPEGHASIIRAIRSHGFCPAIWTNANITNEKFPQYHPQNLIFHEGKPLNAEPEGNRALRGPESASARPKPGDLPMPRLKPP